MRNPVRWKFRKLLLLGAVLGAVLCAGCSLAPIAGVEPVRPFDLSRYLGLWYEVARLDHSFERGLEQVSARYERREDGGVRVINRGFDPVRGRWKESVGRAYFQGEPTQASLKVSFFGPFYGGYHVIALDADYQYALVSGPDRSYLWLLARSPELPLDVRERLVQQARSQGFAVDQLIWVRHDTPQIKDTGGAGGVADGSKDPTP